MDWDEVESTDITSCQSTDKLTHMQRDAENDCRESEKCQEANRVDGLTPTLPIEHKKEKKKTKKEKQPKHSPVDDVILNQAEKPWRKHQEQLKTQELLRRVQSILNKLTPEKFQKLMKQVPTPTINTEERLKGVVELIVEKALSEPLFSEVYANMCRCLVGLKVKVTKPGITVNFRKLLLNRCQKEFEKDNDDDEIFEKKRKELQAALNDKERMRITEDMEEVKYDARRRFLAKMKFIGELFKLKMLTEVIMHECIVKLLQTHNEESLEGFCLLLSMTGKDLDLDKPHMDQYFIQMENLVKKRKTSSRIRFKLEDVIDLRKNNWVPRRAAHGPKTLDQIHKEVEMEEQQETMRVQQALILKKKKSSSGGRMGGAPLQDEGWNTASISKAGPNQSSEPKTTPQLDFNNQLLPADMESHHRQAIKQMWRGVKEMEDDSEQQQKFQQLLTEIKILNINTEEKLKEVIDLTFEKVISEPNFSRAYAKTCHCLKGLKVPSTDNPGNTLNFRKLLLSRCKMEFEKDYVEIFDKKQKELEAASNDEERQRLTSELTEAKEKAQRRSLGNIKFTGELFKVKMLKEAAMHDNIVKLLKNHNEESLECLCSLLCTVGKVLDIGKSKTRMDQYFNQIKKIIKERKTSSKIRFILQEVLDLRQNNWVQKQNEQAVDQIHMEEVMEEHQETGACDVSGGSGASQVVSGGSGGLTGRAFVQYMEFTLAEETEKRKTSELEFTNHLNRLIQDQADNKRILDWIEANLDQKQTSSNMFVRALMTGICQSAVIFGKPYSLNTDVIRQRTNLLQKFLKDEEKELQALYALQALMVQMQQPPNLLQQFFYFLHHENLIKEEVFFKWESSRDPGEQTGKGAALQSLTAFFHRLREEEDDTKPNPQPNYPKNQSVDN